MAEYIICFIIVAVFTLPLTLIWFSETHSKNPFKNMWLFFDETNYNFVGKVILCFLTTILGLPCAILYGIVWLVFWVVALVVSVFNKIFKKKEK